jgi:predicted nucleic acid-binding protein
MSGERLLLDSTFIAGLINSHDQLHLQAKEFLRLVETAAEVVITEAVLIAAGNLLHSVKYRQGRPISLTRVMGRRMSPMGSLLT